MVAGIAAEERDAAVGGAVADDKTQHASVKVDHLWHVADIEPDMAQARRLVLRHRRVSFLYLSRVYYPSMTVERSSYFSPNLARSAPAAWSRNKRTLAGRYRPSGCTM